MLDVQLSSVRVFVHGFNLLDCQLSTAAVSEEPW